MDHLALLEGIREGLREEVALALGLKELARLTGRAKEFQGEDSWTGESLKCKGGNPGGDKPEFLSREQSEGFPCLSEEFIFSPRSMGAIEDFWAGEWQQQISGNVEAGLVGHDPSPGPLSPVLGLERDPWVDILGLQTRIGKKLALLIVTNFSLKLSVFFLKYECGEQITVEIAEDASLLPIEIRCFNAIMQL